MSLFSWVPSGYPAHIDGKFFALATMYLGSIKCQGYSPSASFLVMEKERKSQVKFSVKRPVIFLCSPFTALQYYSLFKYQKSISCKGSFWANL